LRFQSTICYLISVRHCSIFLVSSLRGMVKRRWRLVQASLDTFPKPAVTVTDAPIMTLLPTINVTQIRSTHLADVGRSLTREILYQAEEKTTPARTSTAAASLSATSLRSRPPQTARPRFSSVRGLEFSSSYPRNTPKTEKIGSQ